LPLLGGFGGAEDGACQFSPTRAANRLPQQRLLNESSQIEYTVIKSANRSIFSESLVKISLFILVKTMQTRVYCMCASIYFLRDQHKISRCHNKISGVTRPKFKKLLQDVDVLS